MAAINIIDTIPEATTADSTFIDLTRVSLQDRLFEESEYIRGLYFKEFFSLKQQWQVETDIYSDGFSIFQHPAYLKIIELGHFIIPTLIEDMRKENNHWFVALTKLTGQNPIAPDHAGDIEAMVMDWYNWGKENGFIL